MEIHLNTQNGFDKSKYLIILLIFAEIQKFVMKKKTNP